MQQQEWAATWFFKGQSGDWTQKTRKIRAGQPRGQLVGTAQRGFQQCGVPKSRISESKREWEGMQSSNVQNIPSRSLSCIKLDPWMEILLLLQNIRVRFYQRRERIKVAKGIYHHHNNNNYKSITALKNKKQCLKGSRHFEAWLKDGRSL